MLYRSTDRLCRCGAPMENLAHSASLHSRDNIEPSNPGIKHLAFWDGSAVVWPEAKMLIGTTMGILRRQLERLGVPQRVEKVTLAEVAEFLGAVIMNSWTPGVAVSRIGSVRLPEASAFLNVLHKAYGAEPLTSV